MRIVALSDTHGLHAKIKKIPEGDVAIHCGDFTRYGDIDDVYNFVEWFKKLPHRHKIVVAGNHDSVCQQFPVGIKDMFKGVHYLQEKGVEIDGIKFWGSPYTPKYGNWYFMYRRELGELVWKDIPEDTDVLITHGPPYSILDGTRRGVMAGCSALLSRVYEVKPKVHLFGHIHESYGTYEENGTTFVNAAILNHKYKVFNSPQVVDL
jgi:Icc-related predicted phosphoesterase